MLENWEGVQSLMGATPDSLTKLPSMLRDMLSVQPPEEIENMLRQSGILVPVRFFQAFMICGWHGNKKFSGDQSPQLP
jgi:tRNA (cmo5U34)-methyltransferase